MLTDPSPNGNLLTSSKITTTYAVRRLAFLVQMNYAKDTSDWSNGTWVDETQYVRELSGERQIVPIEKRLMGGGVVPPATCNIMLRNTGGRFSIYRTDGALYSQIGSGKIYQVPVRVWGGFYDGSGLSAPASRTLVGSINSTQTTINLSASVNTGEILRIPANEDMFVTVGGSSSPTVVRGFNGTTAAGYANGTTVSRVGNMVLLFTGVIARADAQEGSRVAQFECQDRSYVVGQQKNNTGTYANAGAATPLTPDILMGYYMDTLSGSPSYLPVPSGQRSFDKGLYPIDYGFMDDNSPYLEASAVAAADGGVLFFNAAGTLKFFNGQHFLSATSQYTFDNHNQYDLSVREDYDALFNGVIADFTPRSLGIAQTVYQNNSLITIPPGGTHSTTIRYQYPCTAVSQPSFVANTGGGVDITGSVTVTSWAAYGLHADVTFTNAHASYDAYLSKLTLTGIPILGSQSSQRIKISKTYSPTGITPRDTTLQENFYRQNQEQVYAVAEMLADRVKVVRSVYTFTAPGVPMLECGDLVTISNSNALSSTRTAFIDSIAWRVDGISSGKNKFVQTLTCSDASSWYASSNFFIVGTSSLNGGAVAWY